MLGLAATNRRTYRIPEFNTSLIGRGKKQFCQFLTVKKQTTEPIFKFQTYSESA